MEIEKILKEIDDAIEDYSGGSADNAFRGFVKGIKRAKKIIQKHMNDGWIPIEEGLPEVSEKTEDDYPEFNVMIEGAKIPTTLQYSNEGIWLDDCGNVYNVIAWHPLPEPYIPKNTGCEE